MEQTAKFSAKPHREKLGQPQQTGRQSFLSVKPYNHRKDSQSYFKSLDYSDMRASFLFTPRGMTPLSNSASAIFIGSSTKIFTSGGAPAEICRALAPIILARSNLV